MDEKPKYVPDAETFMRQSSKTALDAKLAKALDNPRLDAAIARVKPKLKPGEDPLFYNVNERLSTTGMTPVGAAASPSPASAEKESSHAGEPGESTDHAPDDADEPTAPGSPWARSNADTDVDPEALPSSHVPPAAPPTSVPIAPRPGRQLPRRLLGGFSPRVVAAAVAFAILAPLTIAFILSRTVGPAEPPRPATSSAPAVSAAPTATVTMPTAGPTASSVVPPAATTVTPPAVDAGGVPLQPGPSSVPATSPRTPAGIHRPAPNDEPHTPTPPPTALPPASPPPPAPPPPASVAPAPPPTVTPVAPPAAGSPKTPTDVF